VSGVPVHRGPFGEEQARRLLWRAGFGPRPGQAARLAGLGLDRAVHALTHPASARLVGPSPHDEHCAPLAPRDVWGHDHLWWLDRMVRTQAPLIERMTLVWHDWFATSKTGGPTQTLMLRQNALLRRRALGSFEALALDVTRDPAMLLWLNGSSNSKWAPNENYARELQELFTLGAGRGYGEGDVRQMARALTGWRADWRDGVGMTNFRFDPEFHDRGRTRIYGRRGRHDWRDAADLAVGHRLHPSFFVTKLWGYFIPTPPPPGTRRALERLYRRSGHDIRPVVAAILRHPALHTGPRMVKPPVVYIAGLLRALGRGIDTDAWSWLSEMSGQTLFQPPNVAGWDDTRWIDTATWRGRWMAANYALEGHTLAPDPEKTKYPSMREQSPAEAVDAAHRFWGRPTLTRATRVELVGFAQRAKAVAKEPWEQESYAILRQNALRMLIATSPDLHTS
jgi:uncharacterized protein (DUF1800 family)